METEQKSKRKSIDYKTGTFLRKPEALNFFSDDYLPPDLETVLKVQHYIEQEFREHKQPEYYANKVKRTLRCLNDLCQHYLEQSVYSLIQERIHMEVLRLLLHTKMTAKQIAYEMNISTPSYFSRHFKHRMGVSPQQWRKQQRALIMDADRQKEI